MSSKILILSGKQGVGKTSTQKLLTESWYKKFERGAYCVNFADIIYEMHDSVLKILYQYWPKRDIAKDGTLLQYLGTEWGRNTIDRDIWIKILRKKIEHMREIEGSDDHGLVIIGDCRFENEFDAFPEALRVRLNALEEIRKERCSMWRENTQHPSEIGLDAYDRTGKFDMYINTDEVNLAGAVSLISVQLEKGDWLERRTKHG